MNNVGDQHVGTVVFGIEPEDDASLFEGEALFEGGAAHAGEYALVIHNSLLDQTRLDRTHGSSPVLEGEGLFENDVRAVVGGIEPEAEAAVDTGETLGKVFATAGWQNSAKPVFRPCYKNLFPSAHGGLLAEVPQYENAIGVPLG